MSEIFWFQIMLIAVVWFAFFIYSIAVIPVGGNDNPRNNLEYKRKVMIFFVCSFMFTFSNILYMVHKAWIVN